MSPPSSPTRTPSTAGGLRRGEGLRLLRWPTAPSSSMGSIRFRSGGAAREAAAGTLGSISGFPLSCSESTDLADVLGFNFTDVLTPAEGLCVRPRLRSRSSCTVFGFCYLLVWGYIADLSMVPRLRRGRLAGRALSHPFILRGQKNSWGGALVVSAGERTRRIFKASSRVPTCCPAARSANCPAARSANRASFAPPRAV